MLFFNFFLIISTAVVLLIDSSALLVRAQDSCDTKIHPQFGRGTCKEKNECKGVHIRNWCESKAASILCCFENQINLNDLCTNSVGSQLYPHKDEDKYVHCTNGKAFVKQCPSGQIWINEMKYCDNRPAASTSKLSNINDQLISTSFIRKVEGFITSAYCLKDFPASGVTIGVGVDLGHNTYNELKSAGVDEAIIKKLESYFGLKGQQACDAVARNKVVLTTDEAIQLSDSIIKKYTKRAQNFYENGKAASSKSFEKLTCAQRTLIASILYQYGSPGRMPKFWSAVTKNDWKAVISELRNFGDKHSNRRNQEADLIEFDGNKISCSNSNDDICTVTKGSCIVKAECRTKFLPGFCQNQAANVVCCV